MKLNGRSGCGASAWAGHERVQIQIGHLRFSSSQEESIEFCRQILAAVDELQGTADD